MLEYFSVCLVAFFASGLTLFSGFGLGTILTPVLAVFFPVPVAVGATAVVHLVNNIFKVYLVGRTADRQTVIRFGLPAVLAAICGASFLGQLSAMPVLHSFTWLGQKHDITLVKVVVGFIIVIFSMLELSPVFSKIEFGHRWMPLGGFLSGFFGGLSGNQGALRAMFLLKAGLDKEKFIATNVLLAVIVDFSRLLVYGAAFYASRFQTISGIYDLVLAATVAAFCGAYWGKSLIGKVTLKAVQILVGVMLIVLGSAMIFGLI